jgi:hypothetical protein
MRVSLRALGAIGVAPSLGSDIEKRCTSCSTGWATALAVGGRIGYELPSRLSFAIVGGYVSMVHDVDRELTQPFPKGAPQYTTTYALHDRLRLRGTIAGGALAYRVPLGGGWSFEGETYVGAFFASSTDTVTARASAGGDSVDASIDGASQSVASTALFVMPVLGAAYARGAFQVGASFGAFFVPRFGPTLPRDEIAVAPACDALRPGAVGCTPVSRAIASERAYGPFASLLPLFHVGYTF